MNCIICGRNYDGRGTYQRVQGWEQRRTQGGTNHITLREPVPGVVAHDRCIENQLRGIAPEQGTLV